MEFHNCRKCNCELQGQHFKQTGLCHDCQQKVMNELYLHVYPKCSHKWNKEVVGDNWASKKCGKCGVLAIDEAMRE